MESNLEPCEITYRGAFETVRNQFEKVGNITATAGEKLPPLSEVESMYKKTPTPDEATRNRVDNAAMEELKLEAAKLGVAGGLIVLDDDSLGDEGEVFDGTYSYTARAEVYRLKLNP